MLTSTFSIQLAHEVVTGLVTVGKFDGKHPSMACATTGGRVLIHSPHESKSSVKDTEYSDIRFLNLNRQITSLASGCLDSTRPDSHDILFVGTGSTLLAYDVENNSDVFFKDLPDGANTIKVVRMGNLLDAPIVLVGGNCSILGFDKDGNEVFWAVTGDNVQAQCLCDVDGDGLPELLVGSDDFEIRAFKNDEVISETSEADKILFLENLGGKKFAYGLSNGTIGVYDGAQTRLWRVKAKSTLTALHVQDMDQDGAAEVISGWANGSFNVRKALTGEIVFKESLGMGYQIAGVVQSDYRLDGKEAMMVTASSGAVRGYLLADPELARLGMAAGRGKGAKGAGRTGGLGGGVGAGAGAMGMTAGLGLDGEMAESPDDKAINDLQEEKKRLAKELELLERMNGGPARTGIAGAVVGGLSALGLAGAKGGGGSSSSLGPGESLLPQGTAVTFDLGADPRCSSLQLKLGATTDVNICSIAIIDTECSVLAPGQEMVGITFSTPGKTGVVPMRPHRFMPSKLRCQVHLSPRGSNGELVHVIDADIISPRFAALAHLDDVSAFGPKPESEFSFLLGEPLDRFQEWLNSAFLLKSELLHAASTEKKIRAKFVSVVNSDKGGSADLPEGRSSQESLHDSKKRPLDTVYLGATISAEKSKLIVSIRCDSMELTGELVQDIVRFFNLKELTNSYAKFPKERATLADVAQSVTDCNNLRTQLTADVADESQRLKMLIVRAEDARLMGDLKGLRKVRATLLNLLNLFFHSPSEPFRPHCTHSLTLDGTITSPNPPSLLLSCNGRATFDPILLVRHSLSFLASMPF
jgi:Bardet-Biedl syndrome 2 protein